MNPLLAAPLASAIADGARAVLDRVLPDPEKRAAAELELRRLEAAGSFAERADLATRMAQIDVNKIEAGADGYRGGWRPFVGWVCGASLAWTYVGAPIVTFAVVMSGAPAPGVPKLDNAELTALLFALLGIGGMRSFEKSRGVA